MTSDQRQVRHPLQIALCAGNATRLDFWQRALRPLDAVLISTLPPPSRSDPLDLVVTDVDPSHPSLASLDAWRSALHTGLICWVPATGGDLTLPADTTPRELRLACRLVGQIVDLRRQHSAACLELEHLAFQDELTRLPNRRAWDQTLERIADRQESTPICIALFDLDHFKAVNDQWGHTAGDRLLVEAGRALRKNVRGQDVATRLGGDEFGVLLWGLNAERAGRVVERIRRALSETSVTAPHPISSSAGFAVGRTSLSDPVEMQARADQALRQAKRLGRDRTEAG